MPAHTPNLPVHMLSNSYTHTHRHAHTLVVPLCSPIQSPFTSPSRHPSISLFPLFLFWASHLHYISNRHPTSPKHILTNTHTVQSVSCVWMCERRRERERESEECRGCMCVGRKEENEVCVCLSGVHMCVCERRQGEGGGREASRKWGWRGRVRISNRMRIEKKYEAQESREPESITACVYRNQTIITLIWGFMMLLQHNWQFHLMLHEMKSVANYKNGFNLQFQCSVKPNITVNTMKH